MGGCVSTIKTNSRESKLPPNNNIENPSVQPDTQKQTQSHQVKQDKQNKQQQKTQQSKDNLSNIINVLNIPSLEFYKNPYPSKPIDYVIKFQYQKLEVLEIRLNESSKYVCSSQALRSSYSMSQQSEAPPELSIQISQDSCSGTVITYLQGQDYKNNNNVLRLKNITDLSKQNVQNMSSLLKVANFQEKSMNIIEFIILNTNNLSQLKQLSLSSCNITDNDLKSICENFKGLRKINIAFNPISDKGYEIFQKVQIQSIVMGNYYPPEGFQLQKAFSHLIKIQHIHYKTEVTQSDINALLNKAKQLIKINLSSQNNQIKTIFVQKNIELIKKSNIKTIIICEMSRQIDIFLNYINQLNQDNGNSNITTSL